MKMGRIKAKLYYDGDYKWVENGLDSPDDYKYLIADYNGRKYKTKLTKEDLPPSFVYGRFYKRFGWLDTSGVSDIVYVPSRLSDNHVFKDDTLFIRYNGKFDKKYGIGFTLIEQKHFDMFNYFYEQCDILIEGSWAIEVLKAIKKHSGIDYSDIKEQMWQKCLWIKEVNQEYFEQCIKNRDRFEGWWK